MASQTGKKHLKSELVKQALELLKAPSVDPISSLKLAKKLKGRERAFGYARKLLAHALAHPSLKPDAELGIALSQQLALCTYKDPDLPTDTRLDEAFSILDAADSLKKTRSQETLGLAGAIYKRKWELGNNKQHLERSLAYYQRGYLQSKENGWAVDQGYTAINAAFVLDLLASQELIESAKAGASSETAAKRYALAKTIREDIVAGLGKLLQDKPELQSDWWVLVTIGEAHFGLGEYDAALVWLKQANALSNVPDWERESSARQLACLLRLRSQRDQSCSITQENALKVLREFLGLDDAAVASVVTGKIGLALSGGGFRASLYHIGVLARLAELDVLRQVEVVSCVSGGSIVGAHYYLEVRNLLQNKSQDQITRDDYLEIVRRIERDFLEGIQTNIRISVAANWLTNLKMIVLPDYSRTLRVGELYEERIYSRIDDDKERSIDNLMIFPQGEKDDFSPKDHNWRRSAKVPILVLNATALNTGHNWQFTASWMGEPPAGIDSEIDANCRLRRLYYEDAPEKFKKVRLGHAVAASSCVPGLFEPLPLSGLYKDVTVRLIDGGVHDNQGTASLLDQGCTVLLVSDASGQMPFQNQPSAGLLGVPLRANSILQARVRSAQFHELDARRRSSLLQGLMLIHLKKELDVVPQDWIGCEEPSEKANGDLVTTYGVNKTVQEALAGIRTDLDSFTDNEAYSLMLSGYRMTEKYFPLAMPEWKSGKAQAIPWRFLALNEQLSGETVDCKLLKQLEVGSQMAFKVWMLTRPLQIVAIILGIALLASSVVWCRSSWGDVLFRLTVGGLAIFILSVVANRLLGGWFMKLLRYRKTLKDVGLGLAMITFGWLVALLHLGIFDRIFLRQGSRK